MLEKFEAQQFTAEAEEGMEMIQVAFSIAIAVVLGLIVMNLVTQVIAPGMQEVAASSTTLFNTLTETTSGMDYTAPDGGTAIGGVE